MLVLRNLSLYYKVLGVVVLLSAVAGVVTWRGTAALGATGGDLQEVYDQRVTPLRYLKIVSDMYAVNIVDASHKARNGNQPMSDSLVSVNDAVTRINQSWNDYVKGVSAPKEKALIAEVNALKLPADEMTVRLSSALAQNDSAALDALVKQDLYQIIDPLTGKVSELIDLQVAEAGTLLSAANGVIAAVSRQVSLLAGIGITVALLVALWVLTSAVRRLAQTRETILALARGQSAGADSGKQVASDEVGKLVEAVGALQDKLAQDMQRERDRGAEFEGRLNAVGQVQAVIEFLPDGTILSVNELFQRTMGYEAEQMKGKHHRMFVLPAEAETAAYQGFWARLANGESYSGEFQRRRSDGSEVWLTGAYAPIRDADGRVVRVMKCVTDISAQKRHALEQQQLVDETRRVMTALAAGDLSDQMQHSYSGEFESLKSAVNGCVDNLRQMVGQIRTAASSILSGAREIAQGNSDLSQRTEQQASSLEETASSMEELTSTVKQNADNARQADQLAAEARSQAELGGSVVSAAVTAMSGIEESSKRIADIIGVIDEIAFQTNLLALNAAVEAARAGEQGRGFAVVASEVRNLAQRSAGAAKEIKALINDSVGKVGQGSKLVDESGQTLNQIVLSVKKVSDIIGEIAAASQEQSAGIEQVNRAVTNMDQATQQNAALVEQAAAASESMDEQARALSKLVSFFRHGGETVAAEEGTADTESGESQPVAERRSGKRPWSGKGPQPKSAASRAKAPAKVVGGDEWEEF